MRAVNYLLKPMIIDNAKPKDRAYALTDGGGLIMEILPGGSKVWRFKYHLDGKREKVTIGGYPAFSIKQARDKHEEMRGLVERGESPAKAKQTAAVERQVAVERAVTFRVFAARWIDETLFYRSASYRAQIVRWLDSYVYPAIGDKPLANVLPRDILAILDDLVGTPTTADRVRVIVQQIYNFAIRKLLVDTNPATPLRGAIAVPPKKNHPHLNEREIGGWWRSLAKQGAHTATSAASQLLLLTMLRKNELLRAKWDEVFLDDAVFDVPAMRMKNRRLHRVYLSTQAIEILRELHKLTGSNPEGWVFPSIFRGSVPMGGETLNHLFGRMVYTAEHQISPHGTRGTAATLLREHGFEKDVVELLLSHTEKDATSAAYSHHELASERARALQYLADQVYKLAAGAEVIPLRAA